MRTASGPSWAVSSEDFENSQSPARIATWLSHRAFAESAPRRREASSITSSWYSDARWVSSTTQAAVRTPSPSASAVSAASSTSRGRNRLPPACIRCRQASVMNGASDWISRSSRASTSPSRPRSRASSALSRTGSASGGGRGIRHRMKAPASAARSSTGPGTMPSATVAARPTAMATVVRMLGTATVGPSPTGSEKYISTMTRR